jgi:predicted RNA methylase
MKEFIKKFIPEYIIRKRRDYYHEQERRRRECELEKMQQNIICYLENNTENAIPPEEKQKIIDYLKNNPIAIFPYDYQKKYKPEDVTVYTDSDNEMKYVLHGGKRLYFKKSLSKDIIQRCYNGLLVEQDTESPHCYETSEFNVAEGDTVADIGSAEGNFALSVVEKAKKLYLFETDEEWIEVLKATFAPWKEKVVIVNKYVSDNNDGDCITLDKFFAQEKVDFIKADIEGAETQLLEGAKEILSRQTPMKTVLCTYHKHHDADILNRMLTEMGFSTQFSNGYMIFYYEYFDKLQPPYLRKGLIRAVKH